MALRLPLPNQILTHAHWTIGKEKMSKSTGNVVDPFHAIDIYGVDTIRYYLAHDGGINDDADYNNHRVVQRYKEIAGALGNLAGRVTRGKGWSVPHSIQEIVGTGRLTKKPENKLDAKMWTKLKEASLNFTDRFESQGVSSGLKSVVELVYAVSGAHIMAISLHVTDFLQTNKWFQDREPWAMCKLNDSTEPPHPDLALIICLASESLRISGILLQPYIPDKAAHLLDMLGVDVSRRNAQHTELGADDSYGTSKVPLGKGIVGVLFPPLLAED
jgi:methionyl-tRNA synthetase